MISSAKPRNASTQLKRAPRPSRPRRGAPRRRRRRACRTSARGAAGSCSSVALDHRRDAHEVQPVAEERVHGDLVGGVEHARGGPAGLRPPRAPGAGTGTRRGRAARTSSAPTAARSSVRHRHVDALGVVQRVGDRHAHVRVARGAPAWRRRTGATSACTIDCGCTTTSIRSYGVPNSQCASITSRPLFISVAESIVIFPPIAQVGCCSACVDGHAGELGAAAAAERAARRGQRQPLDRPRPLAVDQLVQRGVLGVDRDELRAGRLARAPSRARRRRRATPCWRARRRSPR